MKAMILKILGRLPFGDRLILRLRDLRRQRRLKNFKNHEDLFTAYYQKNQWSDPESLSGPGSTAAYTANIRKELPILIERLKIQRILDAPCGDYNWFRLIDRSGGLDYTGGDIVSAMVVDNESKYGNKSTRFVQLDITVDRLPVADLWLCRDCLFHLSEDLVFSALRNFVRSEIKWLLTSTHPLADFNSDITTGSFRLLNLELPPYNFPPPEAKIEDWVEPHPVRNLALWSRESVIEALKRP